MAQLSSFVMDAFSRISKLSPIRQKARPLLDKAGVSPDEGVVELGAAIVKLVGTRFLRNAKPKVRKTCLI